MATGSYNWRLGGIRSKNVIEARPRRLDATDGSTRYALGRNVKVSQDKHRYYSEEVWTLRHRVDGKVVTVMTGTGKENATAWVERGELPAWVRR